MPVLRPPSSTPSRREFVAIGVGALVLAGIPLAFRRLRVVRRSVPVMGTLADLMVVHPNERRAHAALDAAVARLQAVERLMTRFATTSDVGRINGAAGREAVVVSEETATVLRAALHLADASDGAFDPCLGRAIELWDVAHRREPPASGWQRWAGRRLYRGLDVDTWQGRPAVRVSDPDVRVDLGGIAKGYGVDQAVMALRAWGIDRAIVNVGGDLYALGTSDDGDPWQVGIRAPERSNRLLTSVPVTNGAIATSGTYLAYFEHQGHRYHHLLDPRTAAPRVCAMQSLTIRADDCLTADALGTALFGVDQEQSTRFLARHAPAAGIVHAI